MIDPSDYRATVPDYPWRAMIVAEGAEPEDITRELAVIYDAVIGSLDWGSGFLDREDAEALFRVARICGFDAGTYDVDSGLVPVLVDADGEPLTERIDPKQTFGGPYADRSLTMTGEKLRARRMRGIRNGVAVTIAVEPRRNPDDLQLFSLDEPVPVVAGDFYELTVTLPVT